MGVSKCSECGRQCQDDWGTKGKDGFVCFRCKAPAEKKPKKPASTKGK